MCYLLSVIRQFEPVNHFQKTERKINKSGSKAKIEFNWPNDNSIKIEWMLSSIIVETLKSINCPIVWYQAHIETFTSINSTDNKLIQTQVNGKQKISSQN